MYSEEDLGEAVASGVLSEDQSRALRRYVEKSRHAPAVDEEYVRLVAGFNDVFVVIACSFLLMAIYEITDALAPRLSALALSVAAWGLAEFFTRKRRMAFPSIVLVLLFIGGVFASGNALLGSSALMGGIAMVLGAPSADAVPRYNALIGSIAVASELSALAAWAHWVRFKVPITVAVIAAAVVSTLILLGLRFGASSTLLSLVVFLAGLSVFVVATRWDRSDPQRRTGRSDVAFWLHLLAAPMIVHPAFREFGFLGESTGLIQALGIIGLYVVISLFSLAVDRRALMVSSLAYVLYSFAVLLKQYGGASLAFSVAALVIGSALLLLSAFWQSCRSQVLRLCPAVLRSQLPPLH